MLSYVGRRIDSLPASVVVTARTGSPAASSDPNARVAYNGTTIGTSPPAPVTLEGAPCHPKLHVRAQPFSNGYEPDRFVIVVRNGDKEVAHRDIEANNCYEVLGSTQCQPLDEVFDVEALPRSGNGSVRGYQLIRGVLAANAVASSFVVLCDVRRRDLVEQWFAVMCAVRSLSFRSELKLLTWQELAAVLPRGLRQFLEEKYGVAARDR